ncbi:hypothetical protein C8R43DRAFT_894472 [Mycena crocata]|nr:hypothetical protein C8R43DRAFT_894472 [Mycena crocata]
MSHRIVDVCHRPGIENPVADGLSRGFSEERVPGDGSSWSVAADWHANSGMSNSLWAVTGSSIREPELRERFKGDAFFEPILGCLLRDSTGNSIAETRHTVRRAKDYMVNDGCLWKVADKYSTRTSRVECIPSREGFNTALKIHQDAGCWDVDHVKLHVRDRYFWPHIDSDARLAILMCGVCKNFGPLRRNTLLQPILRGRPFEFVAAGYLKLPRGKGKMANILLFVDACGGFVWGQKQAAAVVRWSWGKRGK